MTNDLTGEEIAELRELLGSKGQPWVAVLGNRFLRLLDEIERRRGRDARTLTLLQRIEWSGRADGDPACPHCGRNQRTDEGPEYDDDVGHRDDCALAALILELQLDAPETPEEKAELDKLADDPEEILRLARERAKKKSGGTP